MVSAPYERKNKKTENIAVRAVKAYISKSILPTYGRFSRGRSHIYIGYIKKHIYIYYMTKIFLSCTISVGLAPLANYLIISIIMNVERASNARACESRDFHVRGTE